MNNRERLRGILHYEPCDRMPVVHFGYWRETLQKWVAEGHLTEDKVRDAPDGSEKERAFSSRLGFDFNYHSVVQDRSDALGMLFPPFERETVEELPDGALKVQNKYGVVELVKPGVRSIPTEFDHLLKDRASWEEHFLPRLQYSEERIDADRLGELAEREPEREEPLGLHCGSLYGQLRDMMGLEAITYLSVDDEPLLDEMIETVGELCYGLTERFLASGIQFEFAHFWEDICFKSGPLVAPGLYAEKVGPHYRRITNLVNRHGIDICSLDCDGKIDVLVPTWLENGVNTMFPIEVGTWGASIRPWREQYGRELRGVGGTDKRIFAKDRAAVDKEIERLKPLVELGGYIPCVDHRIPPTAEWDTVSYYCERMRESFG